MISGQTERVGARLLTEKQHLLPLAAETFDLAEVSYPRVDQAGCAKVRTNSYSVPLKAGSQVEAHASSTTVEFRHDGKPIASHPRCYSRLQKVLDLEHYLDALERKPGALRGSTPLAQWRARCRHEPPHQYRDRKHRPAHEALRLAAVGAQFASLAEEAAQRNHSHPHYLEALLQAEVEDRERRSIELRMHEAHLPRIKTLEEFDFAQSPHIPSARIRALAEGGYLERAEPVLLVGDPGTGKSHLATGLAIAACRQRRRVRFTTAAALVNQLVEAQREQTLSRVLARWSRVELIVIDELGYVPLAEVAAELLFQVVAERAEKAAVIVTNNLPFSEWPQVFTNARLCKSMLDRLKDRAHIIETGSESYRFRRTLRKKTKD